MARCPFANWKPLPENWTQPSIVPTQSIYHSAVDHPGRTDLGNFFDNRGIGVESHFWVYLDGTIDQYIDTEVRADANSGANRRPDGTGAVSTETEDEGNPDARPWTAAQVKSLIRLGRWLADTHGIPARLCRRPDDPGFGYHTLFGAPSAWTSVRGKTCPGVARVKQFPAILHQIAQGDVVSFEQAVVVPDDRWDRALGTAIAAWHRLAVVEADGDRLTSDGQTALVGEPILIGATQGLGLPNAHVVAGGDAEGTALAVAQFLIDHPKRRRPGQRLKV